MTLATTTIKGVELVKVGLHQSALGPVNITAADLSAAVAAHPDPEVDDAPIKLGHTGGLALGDSLPACGWVVNPRLSADGQTMIGDLSNIPSKLAAIIPTAYRKRSVEMRRNVTTASGKVHGAVLTGLALLGAAAPAVKGLQDILDIYASEKKAPTDVADVISAVVEGELISLGNLPPQAPGAPESGSTTDPLRKETTVATLSPEQLTALRTQHKLEATATEAEVLAAVVAASDAAAEAAANGNGPDGDKPTPTAPAAAGTATPAAPAAEAPASTDQIAASAADGTITLSAADFTALTGKVATLEQGIIKTRHDDIILSAMQAGQLVPATEKIYRDLLAKDEALALSAIQALPKAFNTIELGADHAPGAMSTEEEALLKQAEAEGI